MASLDEIKEELSFHESFTKADLQSMYGLDTKSTEDTLRECGLNISADFYTSSEIDNFHTARELAELGDSNVQALSQAQVRKGQSILDEAVFATLDGAIADSANRMAQVIPVLVRTHVVRVLMSPEVQQSMDDLTPQREGDLNLFLLQRLRGAGLISESTQQRTLSPGQ